MDKQAIEAIKAIVAAGVGPVEAENTDYPAVVLPENTDTSGLEKFQANPYRMRARFRTHRISDFCKYVNRDANDDTAVFVDPDGGSALAVIDFGRHDEPRWGEHQASLVMRQTPEFSALAAMTQRCLSQRDLIEFLEDWSHCIHPYRTGEEIAISDAIRDLRRVDIDSARNKTFEEQDFKSSQSALEAIEATSDAGELPGVFILPIAVYEETGARDIEARLSLHTAGHDVAFVLRIVGRDTLMHHVAHEIEAKVETEIGLSSPTPTFIGHI